MALLMGMCEWAFGLAVVLAGGVRHMKFLVHAPNHIAAAAKLLTGFPVADVFCVGAVREDIAPDGR